MLRAAALCVAIALLRDDMRERGEAGERQQPLPCLRYAAIDATLPPRCCLMFTAPC